MRGINKTFALGFGAIIATLASAGIAVLAKVSTIWALWGGIGLLIVAGILMIALVVMLISKKGIIMSKDKEGKQNIIKDTKIKAKVKDAKEAVGGDFEGDYELDNVKVEL